MLRHALRVSMAAGDLAGSLVLTRTDLMGQPGIRHQCANCATPWRTVKFVVANDLMGQYATSPRVTPVRKKFKIRQK
jgi:hypothetical protein